MMRTGVGVLGVLLLAALGGISGCGPKTVPAPVATAPRFPDFVRPVVPRDLFASPAATSHERAWQFLQAADFKQADREVAAALKMVPDFYPAETIAGYVALAEKDPKTALAKFDVALGHRRDYASALAGKGEALAALDRDGEAIDAFQAAFAADAALSDLARRVEVLRFRAVQRDIADARKAAQSGKADDAVRAYRTAIAGSPDTAFLYREVAIIERGMGNTDAALEDFRKASSLDPSDPVPLVQVAGLLEARGDVEAALKAYDAALAVEPDPGVEARRDALRARDEAARLPAEYRAIETAAGITRGDLAALIGVRLAGLLAATPVRDVGVITDIRGHWAESWMLAVTRAGLLDPFADHTFQPRAVVRRVDFAQAVTKLLDRVAVAAPERAGLWINARGKFSDLAVSHVAYPAASAAIASGVMSAAPGGAFQPAQPVKGAEAIEGIERLRAMAGLTAGPISTRR